MKPQWYAIAQLEEGQDPTYFTSFGLDEVLDFLTLSKGADCHRALYSAHTVDRFSARIINEYVTEHGLYPPAVYKGTLLDLLKTCLQLEDAMQNLFCNATFELNKGASSRI